MKKENKMISNFLQCFIIFLCLIFLYYYFRLLSVCQTDCGWLWFLFDKKCFCLYIQQCGQLYSGNTVQESINLKSYKKLTKYTKLGVFPEKVQIVSVKSLNHPPPILKMQLRRRGFFSGTLPTNTVRALRPFPRTVFTN